MSPSVRKKQRALEIHQALQVASPDAAPELRHDNVWQLLIAVILSAQTTDNQVNKVTPALFAQYPTPEALAKAEQDEVASIINSIGFYRNKAKSIIATCQHLVAQHASQVPQTLEELVKLPGVGRKTANVVLGAGFGIDSGIAVDTHVRRIAQRTGLSKQQDPDKVEQDLIKLLPQDVWHEVNMIWVLHGRYTCQARKPQCEACPVRALCPRVGVNA